MLEACNTIISQPCSVPQEILDEIAVISSSQAIASIISIGRYSGLGSKLLMHAQHMSSSATQLHMSHAAQHVCGHLACRRCKLQKLGTQFVLLVWHQAARGAER